MKKTKVLFVGSFIAKTKDDSTGGQTFASLSLINSNLSDKIDWIKIDTTASTNKKRALLIRVSKSIKRLVIFSFHLIYSKPQFILLFAAYGWSFKEKSFMAFLGKLLNKKVVFAPRSGLIKKNIRSESNFSKTIEKALNNIDFLICQSKSWQKFYSSFNKNNQLKFVIINNWLDTKSYSKKQYNNLAINSLDSFRVLFLGWITRNKGVIDLVDAFGLISDESISLQMAGDGDAFSDVESNIKTQQLSNKIELLGWVHGLEKIQLLNNTDLFVLPSYLEGYPNSLLEAMASGIPTIATNIESIADIIIHKKNGYLVRPGDSKGIAEAILWYKNNPDKRQSIIQEGLKSINNRNTLEVAVKKFENIFCQPI